MVGSGLKHTPILRISMFLAIFVAMGGPTRVFASGASLKMTPANGVYEVGGLVDISFVVDTGGNSVNAVQADIQFPPDKLQVVNPVASTSFISLWVSAPTYSNADGTIHFQGGLPSPGIKTSGGVISTVTFRVKSAGNATIKYATSSQVLLNDGQGTNILSSTDVAQLALKLPPPAGPAVTSPTHSDANQWYTSPDVQFTWAPVDGAVGYSFVFDQSAKSTPPDQIKTTVPSATVKATADGVWFMHVRAKTDVWGGVTDYPVRIDTTPPASFTPKFDQSTVTINDTPILRWVTTDAASGVEHYEVKQVQQGQPNGQGDTLFIEVSSPDSLQPLAAGTYTFIVRAFDHAGNVSEGQTTLTVIAAGLPFYARVPFLRNPAVANITLAALLLATILTLGTILIRRIRLRDTFRHDLIRLEHDAQKKTEALQKELAELREAQSLFQQPNPPPQAPFPPTQQPPQ